MQMLCAKTSLTGGIRAGTVAQLVQYLPSMQEALGHLVSSITWEQSGFQEVAAEDQKFRVIPGCKLSSRQALIHTTLFQKINNSNKRTLVGLAPPSFFTQNKHSG